jgi:hypothetical protein
VAVTRRAFVGGLAVALLGGATVASGQERPRSRGWRWRGGTRTAASGDAIRAPFEFNAVGVSASARPVGLRIRASSDGTTWSDWQAVANHEAHGRPAADARFYADLVVVPPGSRYAQVDASSSIQDLALDFIDTAIGPRTAQGTPVSIIPRAEWGCDESLSYDRNGREIWPPVIRVPEKVVVHHTATANREADTTVSVRAIYYYHAVSQGWGDIGYNYLVDWKGNVFEGRIGGRGVEAGHAFGHNPGSIGIACMGTYTSESITLETRRSVARLIAQLAPALDPHDTGWFVDGDMPNLMGHRDAMQYRPADATECPGDALYSLLSGIRGDVLFNIGSTPIAAASILNVTYEPSSPAPGAVLTVTATIKNTGSATLCTQLPTPATLYLEGETFDSLNMPSRVGAWRLGLNTRGGDYPFRWGLPEALEPGKTATVQGRVTFGDAGPRVLSVGLVRENRYWYIRDAWQRSVTVGQTPSPTPTPAPSATPTPTATPIPTPTPPLTNRSFVPISVRAGQP